MGYQLLRGRLLATPKFNHERASIILAEAYFHHDDAAVCSKWNIARSTLVRYRAKVLEDPKLAHLFAMKKIALQETWIKANERTILRCNAAIEQIIEMMLQRGDCGPADIHAIAGAIQISSNAIVASKMVDATVTASLGAATTIIEDSTSAAAGLGVKPVKEEGITVE